MPLRCWGKGLESRERGKAPFSETAHVGSGPNTRDTRRSPGCHAPESGGVQYGRRKAGTSARRFENPGAQELRGSRCLGPGGKKPRPPNADPLSCWRKKSHEMRTWRHAWPTGRKQRGWRPPPAPVKFSRWARGAPCGLRTALPARPSGERRRLKLEVRAPPGGPPSCRVLAPIHALGASLKGLGSVHPEGAISTHLHHQGMPSPFCT